MYMHVSSTNIPYCNSLLSKMDFQHTSTDDETLLDEALNRLYQKESDFDRVSNSFDFVTETIQNGFVCCLTTMKILSYLKEVQSFRRPKLEKEFCQAEDEYAEMFKGVWIYSTNSESEGK